jgi:stress-induced-phosphoprotein 1
MSGKEKAQSLKLQGNEAYKKKDFAEASKLFEEAIQTDPTEITFYTNLAAVYFETKVSDQCDSFIYWQVLH